MRKWPSLAKQLQPQLNYAKPFDRMRFIAIKP
jgi:hypothetical protein